MILSIILQNLRKYQQKMFVSLMNLDFCKNFEFGAVQRMDLVDLEK